MIEFLIYTTIYFGISSGFVETPVDSLNLYSNIYLNTDSNIVMVDSSCNCDLILSKIIKSKDLNNGTKNISIFKSNGEIVESFVFTGFEGEHLNLLFKTGKSDLFYKAKIKILNVKSIYKTDNIKDSKFKNGINEKIEKRLKFIPIAIGAGILLGILAIAVLVPGMGIIK